MYTILLRYAAFILLSFFFTVLIFWVMRSLIHSDANPFTDPLKGKILTFVPVQEEREVKRRKRPKPPPPPELPELEVPKVDITPTSLSNQNLNFALPNLSHGIDVDPASFVGDGEYLPIVVVQPIYPRRALTRGIEGYVVLEFTVNSRGTVENPTIIESKPSGVFERSAKQAALKYKYKPKIENGVPVDTHGVRYRIKYTLRDK